MDYMVIEIYNREIMRKTKVHGHDAAVKLANEWLKAEYANATSLSGHEYANSETNCAWLTYANGKGYDVHVVEVA